MKLNLNHLVIIFFQVVSVLITPSSHSDELTSEKINTIKVSNINELNLAMAKANSKRQGLIIELADGVYSLSNTLKVRSDNLTLLGNTNNPKKVILKGDAMSPKAMIGNLIRVEAKHFTLDGITLEQSGYHLIQIAGESGAQSPTLRNCILKDAYQQLIKVTYGKESKNKVSYGLIENCLFIYSAGIGPNWYIGGLDAHGAKNWTVINNTFKNIASPKQQEAEHAIHFWNGSENNTVRDNTIIDCDRGIGFGLGSKGNIAGIIDNNFIYHSNNKHRYADAGIILESSPDTVVSNNIVIIENSYPSAIEYRFSPSKNILITSNKTNKMIRKRDGAHAILKGNEQLTDDKIATFKRTLNKQNSLK